MEQTSTFANVLVQAFDGDGTSLAALRWNDVVAEPGAGPTRRFDFTGVGLITSIGLNSDGDTAFYGDFSFRRAGAPVPAPSVPALLMCALALVAARGRGRRVS